MSEKPTTDQPITIRFPHDVREALRRYASEDTRSFNGEVIWVLQQYIKEREQKSKRQG